jgi:hypothetical protein
LSYTTLAYCNPKKTIRYQKLNKNRAFLSYAAEESTVPNAYQFLKNLAFKRPPQ